MRSPRTFSVALTTGAVAVLGASACCAGPRLMALFDCKVRWVARMFSTLAPYDPLFIAIAAAAFGVALYRLYAAPALEFEPVAARGVRAERLAFWTLTAVSLALILLPVYTPRP